MAYLFTAVYIFVIGAFLKILYIWLPVKVKQSINKFFHIE